MALALGESPYRSSPFFWAFRQATAGVTTPVDIPGADVLAGDAISSAIYGITDTLPFYDIGSAIQRFAGVCSDDVGCDILEDDCEDEKPSDGATTTGVGASEPSDGGNTPMPTGEGSLVSEVDLQVARLFGLPRMESKMTTTAVVRTIPRAESSGDLPAGAFDVEVEVRTTSAKQSSIATLLPALDDALSNFPSGDALEALKKGSSLVKLRTTYLSDTVRVSRPLLKGTAKDSLFVYIRS